MKNKFSYYYPADEKREKTFWSTCQFMLDTNVLLDLLRLDEDLTNKALATITNNKKRIHIPYYAGVEYHRHFREVVVTQRDALAKVKQDPHHIFNAVLGSVDNIRIPNSCKASLFEKFKPAIEQLFEEINKRHKYFDAMSLGMDMQIRVGESLDGLVLDYLSSEEISALETQGQKRYQSKVPPGYMDNTKGYNKYGDYIIWSEILKFTSKNQCDVCFVSRDHKEDWFEISNGKKLCPRYELQQEFQCCAPGKYFKIITLDYFLQCLDANNFSPEELKDVKGVSDKLDNDKELPITQKESGEDKEVSSSKDTDFEDDEVGAD